MRLLALDTATELCSAALYLEGTVAVREAWAPRAHGGLILPMIEELLRDGQIRGAELEAVAFGRGPGAFTGVRLATAVAQGLGYAWGKPLIPVSDLRALAARALVLGEGSRALICQDARMEEVYWACFERSIGPGAPLRLHGEEQVSAPAQVVLPQEWRSSRVPVLGAGSGFAVYAALREFGEALTAVFAELRPRAREIASLAAEGGLSAAIPAMQAQPAYLRDRVTTRSGI